MAARSRPLSPHLQIYKFTLTMAMSIVQRGTGMAMYFGTLLIVLWLGAAALGDGPLAVLTLAVVFWVTEAIPLPATALLASALCIVLQVAPAKAVLTPFADPVRIPRLSTASGVIGRICPPPKRELSSRFDWG